MPPAANKKQQRLPFGGPGIIFRAFFVFAIVVRKGVKVFTFRTHTPCKRPTKTLVFSGLKFDGAPFCAIFEDFRERLQQQTDKTA
jgi:hypothetical protein